MASLTPARYKHIAATALVVVLACGASLAAGHLLPLLRVAENWAGDVRIAALTPYQPQSSDIVVVTITEETLARFPYRSPVDRLFLSDLLTALQAKQARLVGVDLLFDQPTEAHKDATLRHTLSSLSVPLVVAWAGPRDGLTAQQSAFVDGYLVEDLLLATPAVTPDRVDGTVRSLPMRSAPHQPVKPFARALAEALGVPPPQSATLTLRFRNGPDDRTPAFPTYPAHTVSLLPDDWFSGKVVLIGADLPFTDRLRTPFSVLLEGAGQDMAGVFVHAHALAQMLDRQPDPGVPAWSHVALAAALAAAGAASSWLGRATTWAVLAPLVSLVVLWIGGFALYQRGGPLIPLVAPTLACLLAAAMAYFWQWSREFAQRRFIRTAFAKLVAPSVVDYLTADPRRLHLGGERREMTFLFTDIADFTTFSETTEPMSVVTLMQEYLQGACEIVFAHGGTLNKIVGDGLVVMFNAPVTIDDHPQRAVMCALALDRFCQSFAARKRSEGIDFGVTRMGVNTGTTVVGNYGGEDHFEYTATGDAINAAARLESVNKQLGTRLCVSGATAERCTDVLFRPIGDLVLKGKSNALACFEPVQNDDRTRCDLQAYLSAYRLMGDGQATAPSAFRRLAVAFPNDPLVRYHAARLARGESGRRIVMTEK